MATSKINYYEALERLWTKERFVATTDDSLLNRYRSLRGVLEDAFNRAVLGKGAERHARGDEKFEDQYILRGARDFGLAGLQFQIGKKNLEVCNLVDRQAKINEFLDIVIYASASVILLMENNDD